MDGDAPAPDETDLVALVRQLADDAVRLARAEVQLMRAQLVQAALRLAVAVGLFLMAALLVLIGIIDALGALPEAFGPRLLGSSWAGWLVLGGLFIVLAIVLALLGRSRLRRSIKQGTQTLNTAKEDVEWLKALTKRSVSGS